MSSTGETILKVLVTGPESSGKSTLCNSLAQHFQCSVVNEYARDYLIKLNRPYMQSDLGIICRGQMAKEKKILTSAKHLIICDTGPEVIKIWSEVKYGSCPKEIEDMFQTSSYDLVFLCKPDFNWVPDDLREHPEQKERDMLYHLYQNTLMKKGLTYTELTGNTNSRKELSIFRINQILNKK